MFSVLSKTVLLAVYGLVLLSYITPLPLSTDAVGWLRIGVLMLLVVHLLEVVLRFHKVALHKKPLSDSVPLTLSFGFLHQRPLADATWQAH